MPPVVETQSPNHGTAREFPEIWLIKLQIQIQSTVGRSSGCGRNHLHRRCCSWKRDRQGPVTGLPFGKQAWGTGHGKGAEAGKPGLGSAPFTRPYLLPSG